jgi:hypothetical protein
MRLSSFLTYAPFGRPLDRRSTVGADLARV